MNYSLDKEIEIATLKLQLIQTTGALLELQHKEMAAVLKDLEVQKSSESKKDTPFPIISE